MGNCVCAHFLLHLLLLLLLLDEKDCSGREQHDERDETDADISGSRNGIDMLSGQSAAAAHNVVGQRQRRLDRDQEEAQRPL